MGITATSDNSMELFKRVIPRVSTGGDEARVEEE